MIISQILQKLMLIELLFGYLIQQYLPKLYNY